MAKSRLVGSYPVIGIRPTIDGRRGALDVRGSLEEQTMNMAKSAAKLFEENLNTDFISATLSSPRTKGGVVKVKVRPLLKKGTLFFQLEEFKGNQAFHRNLPADEACAALLLYMEEMKQLQMETRQSSITALVSKKGKVTVKKKARREPAKEADLSHNRQKRYILEEGVPVPFLVDLGVMTGEGRVVHAKFDKFRQINRFIEMIDDAIREYKGEEIHIIDFGCGKSYLTFIMYYYFTEIRHMKVRMLGLDLKKDVIEKCNRAAEKYGYDNLRFELGDINGFQTPFDVDMVVTLHACDTATDFALYNAITWNAKMIFSVPCCQHEVNKQIQSEDYSLLTRYGIIKERFSALTTDAIRANLLECCGYKTQLLEFIDFEHTPKNILIRAVRRPVLPSSAKKKYLAEVENMCREFHLEPTLYTLLRNDCKV